MYNMRKEIEKWKDIPGYEGMYQASDFGNVRSLNYRKTKKIGVMSQTKNKNGYLHTTLYKNKKTITVLVHRAVIMSFYGVSELHVNHKNMNKTDNSLANLEFCTRSENMRHALNNKKFNFTDRKGSLNINAKLSEGDVLEIKKKISEGFSNGEICLEYNVQKGMISKIRTGRNWGHVILNQSN